LNKPKKFRVEKKMILINSAMSLRRDAPFDFAQGANYLLTERSRREWPCGVDLSYDMHYPKRLPEQLEK